MGKIAIDVSEQIDLLESRGMVITDRDKAQEVLLDIGYYRLGFYWFPFEKTYPNKNRRTHQFREGTNFDYIVKLYYFDFNLRNILTKYLNRIEINFRTFLTYQVSNRHKESPTWFVDPAIVSSKFAKTFDQRVYTTEFMQNFAIKQHHKTHINDKYAPAWKTIEFMTLGAVIALFRAIIDRDTCRIICNHFGVKHLAIFNTYLSTINTIRNHCAHGNILYDISLPTSIRKGPAGAMSSSDYQNLHGAIRVIYYLIGHVSRNRQNDLKKELTDLFEKYKEVPEVYAIIQKATGIENIGLILV